MSEFPEGEFPGGGALTPERPFDPELDRLGRAVERMTMDDVIAALAPDGVLDIGPVAASEAEQLFRLLLSENARLAARVARLERAMRSHVHRGHYVAPENGALFDDG